MTTVLVIDDDAEMREFLRRALEGVGYTVIEAADGLEGMRKFRENAVDLVVTDIVMPHQGGIETILQLKTTDPHIRVIGISGGGMATHLGFLRTAGRLGADAWLAKPFIAAELLKTVAEVLGTPPPGGKDTPPP
jgi:CheY-like chemotaxis protein